MFPPHIPPSHFQKELDSSRYLHQWGPRFKITYFWRNACLYRQPDISEGIENIWLWILLASVCEGEVLVLLLHHQGKVPCLQSQLLLQDRLEVLLVFKVIQPTKGRAWIICLETTNTFCFANYLFEFLDQAVRWPIGPTSPFLVWSILCWCWRRSPALGVSQLREEDHHPPVHSRGSTRSRSTAQCVLCSVYFSAQLNKLRPILKLKKYYPIQHIFVPACSSARKIHFFKF